MSENHKFKHLPFSLEVKCKGFRTEQASTSVTCQRETSAVCQIQIYIHIFIFKKKERKSPCDTTFRLQSLVQQCGYFHEPAKNLSNKSNTWLLFDNVLVTEHALGHPCCSDFSESSFKQKTIGNLEQPVWHHASLFKPTQAGTG